MPAWWREEFRRLDGLPLLPCGAGESKKAPFPSGWQDLSFHLDEVMAYPGVRCIGMRCGPDAAGVLVVDYDGPSAIQFAAEKYPEDLNEPTSWIIGRENNPNRYKVAYYVPMDRWSVCKGKSVLPTGDGEQIEFFWSSGQVIVAGEHVTSGGEYSWLNGSSPDEIQPIPDAVWAMYQHSINRGGQFHDGHGTDRKSFTSGLNPRRSREERGAWQDLIPCPICGRREVDCRISEDGNAILCHRGSRWHPPHLQIDETIERYGDIWQYKGLRDNHTGQDRASYFRRAESQEALRQKPKKRITADLALTQMRDELGDTPKLNVRTRGIECRGREFTPDEVDNLYLHMSRGKWNWSKQLAADAFITLAGECEFDPVMTYLGNLDVEPLAEDKWERLDQWMFNIDDPIAARYLQRYAVAAVARVFEPGVFIKQLPVLLGPQSIGKTQMGRALFSDEWYGDGISRKMDVDDETLMALTWGCEFSEFDGYTRSISVEKLKAFISRPTGLCRRKYGKGTERIPRRSVFWGTANKSPLVDRTGSSRFCLIPLPKEKLPVDRVQLDRDAFWARALIAYRQGFQYYSTEEEEAEIVARNSGYDIQDPWETPIGDFVRSRGTSPYIRIDEVYRELDIPAAQQTTTNANRITECMASHGWIKARRRVGNRSTRVYAFFPDEVDKVPAVEKLPPLTEEQKRDRWHSAMRKHSEQTDEPFDRRSQGH